MTTRRRLRLAFLAALAATIANAQVTYQDLLEPSPEDWLTYGRTFDSQRHSPLDEIDQGNVGRLAPAWMFQVPGATRLEAVPLVSDGVMYLSRPNAVFALDARSGRQVWRWDREPAIERGPNRGVALLGDLVYVGTPDAYLVALDARTGAQVWEAKVAEVEEGYYCPVAPFAIDGKVLMGVAAGDYGLNGWLDAYDAYTGERLWRWHTIPRPGEPGNETWSGDSWKTGGGGTWLTGSYDPELNLLYWGIGNPAPDFDGDVRLGDNLYTESVVALDGDSGKLKWHFQFTPHDVHDWDSVEIPILIDAPFDGEPRKLLLHADRNGYYYVLDRETGEFLHGSPFIDKLNWATGLTEKGRPIRVPGVEPTMHGNLVCPSTSGATNWMSPAYNPDTGRFYLAVKEGCGISYKAKQRVSAGRRRLHGDRLQGEPGGPVADVRAGAESYGWREGVGVRAGDVSALRRRAGLDGGRVDLRRGRPGLHDRSRCGKRSAAVALQHRRAHQRLADRLWRQGTAVPGGGLRLSRGRVCSGQPRTIRIWSVARYA